MKTNRIAILGGTGKAGKYLVQNLINKNYPVRLLLRNPENFNLKSELIEIVKGDARDYKSVSNLIKDSNTVISTIGQPKREKPIFCDAAKNIIRSMGENNIKRYIATTGLNVDTPFDRKNDKVKMATDWMYQNYPETTLDKQKEYEMLATSNINWTLVRLPLIIQTVETFNIETSLTDCKGENISAADLAEFIVSQINDETYLRKSPFLYNI